MKKQQKTQKILVPLDGSKNSEQGLMHAINLALQTNRDIIGLYVIPLPLLSAVWRPVDLQNEMLKEAKQLMIKTKIKVEQKNIIFQEKIKSGVPGVEIVTFAGNKKNNVSIIVIGSGSKGISKEKYFGSVSNHVLNKSKIPVMIV